MKIEDKLPSIGRFFILWIVGSCFSFILVVLCVSMFLYVFGIGNDQIPRSIWEAAGAVVGGLIFVGEEQRIRELEEELNRRQGQKGSD